MAYHHENLLPILSDTESGTAGAAFEFHLIPSCTHAVRSLTTPEMMEIKELEEFFLINDGLSLHRSGAVFRIWRESLPLIRSAFRRDDARKFSEHGRIHFLGGKYVHIAVDYSLGEFILAFRPCILLLSQIRAPEVECADTEFRNGAFQLAAGRYGVLLSTGRNS